MRLRTILKEFVETLLSSIIILMVLYYLLAFPEIVSGSSMEPNIYDGERILVERVSRIFNGFNRGEIVVLHPPEDDNIDYVKRIIGIPGDTVRISDCKVFVSRDGKRFMLEEPYLSAETCTQGGVRFNEGKAQKIEDGTFLVLGDNREKSADSRIFGVISEERIVGKVVFRFWPFSQISFL